MHEKKDRNLILFLFVIMIKRHITKFTTLTILSVYFSGIKYIHIIVKQRSRTF